MFIEFSPTPDESSRIAVNVSALDVIELNIAEDECEVCAKTPTGVYGLYYGDRETAESRYDNHHKSNRRRLRTGQIRQRRESRNLAK